MQYNGHMNYYEVWVRSNRYHGNSALTYSSAEKIIAGQLVKVPLRNELVWGVVMSQTAKPRMQTKPIETVLKLAPLPLQSIELMHWLHRFYPAPIGIIVQQFIPQVLKDSQEVITPALAMPSSKNLPNMTNEQLEAYKNIGAPDTYLLHGRTGSGKTRLYIELAKDSIIQGRSVIMLTPEISLTSQLEFNFKQVFGDHVVLLHSTLTPKQRTERWVSLLMAKEPMIVIGPRSAIFSPLGNTGLIIIDEEHEPAYKQEQSPYYLTSRVAAKLRQIQNAQLILGSATPLITDYYAAKNLSKPILRLKSIAQENAPIMQTRIVDSKDRTLFERSSYFSKPLISAIDEALAKGHQALLYLNRRGTARVIICENCDWQARCPRCDLPLTYHGDNHSLRCHVCGFSSGAPVSCPKCANPSVRYLSIGTKAVVEEAAKLFPNARIKRFDADNLKADRIEQNLESIKAGEADIIVGTQMLAKGLDLPKLGVVGVLMADTSLQMPDYTSSERTYQLIQQVVGRVGRGHVPGIAIIQSFQPDNKTIIDALEDNWEDFYAREIEERKQFIFPPFTHLLKLTVQRASPKAAEQAAAKLASSLEENLIVEGPAPSFHEKVGGKYRWQLVVKSKQRSSLIELVENIPSGWTYDLDPIDLM